jgi:hypothetical protein
MQTSLHNNIFKTGLYYLFLKIINFRNDMYEENLPCLIESKFYWSIHIYTKKIFHARVTIKNKRNNLDINIQLRQIIDFY